MPKDLVAAEPEEPRGDFQTSGDGLLCFRSLRASFFVPVICFAVVGIYALMFSGKKAR